jgi:hypothetical protein
MDTNEWIFVCYIRNWAINIQPIPKVLIKKMPSRNVGIRVVALGSECCAVCPSDPRFNPDFVEKSLAELFSLEVRRCK